MGQDSLLDVVFARVALPAEIPFKAGDYRVEAWSEDQLIASAASNNKGQIRLDFKRSDRAVPTELRVYAPWGTEIQRRTLTAKELDDPHELLLKAALPPAILSPDGTGFPVPRVVSLVSQTDMDVFHAVTGVAAFGDYFPQAGGPLAEVCRIYELLEEIEQIYHWSYGALRGDPRHIRSLKSHLEEQACFEDGHHDALAKREEEEEEQVDGKEEVARNYVAVEDADALPLAGVLLDAIETDAPDHSWAERARCYYLSRAAIIQRAFGAAEAVAQGKLELEVFAAILKSVASLKSHSSDHDEDELTVPIEQWDGATIRWARHAEEIQAIGKREVRDRDIPILVDRIDPAAIGAGQVGTLTFLPAVQSKFPTRPKGKLDGILALWHEGTRHLLKISRWDENKIEAKLPRDLPVGRGVVYWEAPSPSFPKRVSKPSPEPGGQGGQRGSHEPAPAAYYLPGQIALPVLTSYVNIDAVGHVVGSRSVGVWDLSGIPQLEYFVSAESCTEVRIQWDGGASWSSEPITGAGIPASVRVSATILANGEVLQSGAPASGEIIADPSVSMRYEVRVEAHVGTVSLGIASRILRVDRIAQIRLEVADRVFPLNAPVPITVRLSCPAPGLRVVLTSADLNLLESNSFPMPDEAAYATGLRPAGGSGTVNVTASAVGHSSAQVVVYVGNSSCIRSRFDTRRFGGEWNAVPTSPGLPGLVDVVGVHIAVLHTGKVLLFNYNEGHFPVVDRDRETGQWLTDILAAVDADLAECRLWDPATGVVTRIELGRNLFCSGHAFLADGRLFIASGQFHVPVWKGLALFAPLVPVISALVASIASGGNYSGAAKDLHIFRPDLSTFERLSPDMEAGRWYPTCITLPSGKVMVISGTSGAAATHVDGGIQDTFEIFDPAQPSQRHLVPLGFYIRHLYPFMHVLPSGKVFVHYMRTTALFDPGTEQFQHLDGRTVYDFSRTGPGPGTSVLLPLLPTRHADGSVEYPAGKVLILGGGGAEGPPEPREDGPIRFPDLRYTLDATTPATASAEIMDFSTIPPVWRNIMSMRNPRVMPDSVILPNGKVLVVNGTRNGMAGAYGGHLGRLGPPRDPVLEPEMFDPATVTWERLCPMTIPRGYHATAALLPDARVLVAGNDGLLNNYAAMPGQPPLRESKYQLEIFSPPYLFRGPRPIISSAPAIVDYLNVFQIEMRTDVSEVESVCLIRQSSETHQINTDQRYVGLAMIPNMSRTSLTVQAPPNANIAPPGFYMLFVVNRTGVPSVAHWLQMRLP